MMKDACAARKLFSYDPDSGHLFWREDRIAHLLSGNDITRARKGDVAGARHIQGYWTVRFNGRSQLAHRVIWLIVHGNWPPAQIDHINGDRSDNRLANLRVATQVENCRNRGKQRNNKSGFKGVSWAAREGKWNARIKVDGVYKSLGYFGRVDDAADAYRSAAKAFHRQFARVE